MDPTTFAPADWAALTSSVPKLAALAGLALSVGLVLALLLTFLVGLPEIAEVEGTAPRSVRRFHTVAPTEPPSMLAERSEPALVGALARAGTTTADLPSGVGLSPADLIALRAPRERVRSGEVAEGPTGADRLAFARWLVVHGRLVG